jgi:hypothetical protein
MDDPLHATIEEFAAEGFTHVECYCPQCRMTRLRPISYPLATGKKRLVFNSLCPITGGWGGIRTLETLARLPVFKTGAFNHSATHPA